MNYYQDEITAKYNRDRVRDEFNLIRLEQVIPHTQVYRLGMFTRTMHSFATWMISTGRDLHERYELPTAHTHHRTSNFFAP